MSPAHGYSFHPRSVHGEPSSPEERERREAYLGELRPLLRLEADECCSDSRLSARDRSWSDWLERTGELPPDFERLPATADLPDPLCWEVDGEWERIATRAEWARQRERLREQLSYWVYGHVPPPPENLRARETERRREGRATLREISLAFGPGHEATLTAEVVVPDGEGPFPVLLTQWNHRGLARLALRRGYLTVRYAAADERDDTADYPGVYPEYDFQVLARRAWAASRVVDYLETLREADSDRIGITGASRNGKQSLLAAAFDDRIAAVVPCSAGSGAVVPARFDRDDCYAGDVSLHARLRRSWFHPRWRFFVGRENHLPVDANSLVSLVAPRACMIHTALNERTTNAWAVGRVYESASSVYGFLDAGEHLAIRYREGRHARTTRDLHHVLDFFDRVFGRGGPDGSSPLPHRFDFEEWFAKSGTDVDVGSFPKRGLDDLLLDERGESIETAEAWEERREAILEGLRWSLGERPPNVPSRGSVTTYTDLRESRGRPDYRTGIIGRPQPSERVGRLWVSPRHAAGDRLGGTLYYPRDGNGDRPPADLPVIVWLHPYSYTTGYGAGGRGQVPIEGAIERGFGLFCFDQLGFGTRVTEGDRFYDRHPGWSKMGRLVEDTLAAVETLSGVEFVDSDRISLLGYSLGATFGLYATALDERVRAIASVCGFSPLRLSTPEKEREHAIIRRLSHMHGLQPRLGCFLDDPARIPFDFDELLGSIAPRPALVVAPSLDWTHPQEDVERCVEAARSVYELYGHPDRLDCRTPDDLLSFDYHEARLYDEDETGCAPLVPERRAEVFDWLSRVG